MADADLKRPASMPEAGYRSILIVQSCVRCANAFTAGK
jgi:hypothetical protein